MALLRAYFHLNNSITTLNKTFLPATSILSSESLDVWTNQKRYAARKGKRIAATREKQRLARLKREEAKSAPPKIWKPQNLFVDKSLNYVKKKFSDDDRKSLSEVVDNVFAWDQYKEKKYPFEEALIMIRETHHPEIYDEPESLVEAKVEFDLRTKKKTKFVERFRGVVSYPHLFDYGMKRKVIAICKTPEDEEIARKAGAELSGCGDILRMLKAGEITLDNFDELVCHGDMLVELAAIKNVVGSYFPSSQRGNVGFDMDRLVRYFVNGIEYKLEKYDMEPDYGFVQIPIGRLNQSDQELKENFEILLKSLEEHQPAGSPGQFITRTLLYSEPCPDKHSIAFWNNIEGYKDPTTETETETMEETKKIKQKVKG